MFCIRGYERKSLKRANRKVILFSAGELRRGRHKAAGSLLLFGLGFQLLRAPLACSLLRSLYSWHSSLSRSTKYAVIVIIIIIMFFEVRSHYIALGVLDLAM